MKYIRAGSDLLLNISLSVGQSKVEKSLALRARDLSHFKRLTSKSLPARIYFLNKSQAMFFMFLTLVPYTIKWMKGDTGT